VIGFFTAGTFPWPSGGFLILAALAAFFLRQPLTHLIKVLAGRRGPGDLYPALTLTAAYALLGVWAALRLKIAGFANLLWLAIPGFIIFSWHLFLVQKRTERRRPGVDMLAAGALALAAPAAYWLSAPFGNMAGWWLFGLTWLQSAASISFAFQRLEERAWDATPELWARAKHGWRAFSYTTFNVALALAAAGLGWLPAWLWLAFLVQWLEWFWGLYHPAVGWKPTQIGLRQLAVSALFTCAFILLW
jgi:hypothetical protein